MMTVKKGKNLFDEVTIGKLTLKNRLSVAPMTRVSASADGTPTEKMRLYYSRFAKGGFGLIITEGTYIDDRFSQAYSLQPGIVTENHIGAWKKISQTIHDEGAKAIMQIQHAGALSQGSYYRSGTIAPSSIKPKGEQLDFYFGKGEFGTPIAISPEEIEEVKFSFAKAAKNAQKAGFDGVEIHGANGYLLDQFLTDYTNKRNDIYGGNIENRVRLLSEVVSTVKQAVGKDIIVGIRISQAKVNDYFHKWQGEADAKIIFNTLKNAGADYLHITEFSASAPAFVPEDNQLSLAELAKKITGLPVFANGQINNESTAIEMLAKDIDMLAIGKAALANHNFPDKLKTGESLLDFDPDITLKPTAELKESELY